MIQKISCDIRLHKKAMKAQYPYGTDGKEKESFCMEDCLKLTYEKLPKQDLKRVTCYIFNNS